MTADTGNGTGPASGPPSWPWVARPAGWFLSPEESGLDGAPESADPADYGSAPADYGSAPSGQVAGEWFVAGQDEPQSYWYEDDDPQEPEDPHVMGPTAALNGLPGGPGFAVPPGAVGGLSDERSPWEQAEGVWRGSGISWEQPEATEPSVADPADGGPAFQAPPAFGGRPAGRPLSAPTMADTPLLPPRTPPVPPRTPPVPPRTPPVPPRTPPTRAEPVYDGEPAYDGEPVYDGEAAWDDGEAAYDDAVPPTRAEPVYDSQARWQSRPPARPYRETRAPGPRTRADADERDQISEVWRNQQLRYPDLPARTRVRRGPRRRPVARTALKVGVPVFVIVAVGVGAVMMLTGKTKMVLAERGDSTTAPRASTAGNSGAANKPATPATNSNTPAMVTSAATLPGYPGRGVSGELVEGLGSGNGTKLAVGTVDGLPAIWSRAANGSWSLVTQNTAGITSRAAVLTTVVHGIGGWVAVGVLGNNAAPHPVVLVSADGQKWQFVDGEHSFAYPGAYAYGAAAGRAGYIVIGKIVHGGRTVAATWWSTDLYHWIRGGNGGLDGRLTASQMLAAAATPGGFVAVGQHGRNPAAWMAGTAHDWMLMDLPTPAGATSAAVTRVAASGERLVALGNAETSRGIIPFAAVSSDGGASWREVPIVTPGGRPATVTAVTATASGFTAAAQASGNDAIYWTSADGTAWSAPRQAGSGIAAITGLIPAGSTMAGIGESPAGRPVIWTAR